MTVMLDMSSGRWVVCTRFRDLNGYPKRTTKRGFACQEDALEWEAALRSRPGVRAMILSEFFEAYRRDVKPTASAGTWKNKELLFRRKIEPHLGCFLVEELSGPDILLWQEAMRLLRKPDGGRYSQTYLRSINNQIEAILNHAVAHYGLSRNPMAGMRKLGRKEAGEMVFWTREEYLRFADQVEGDARVHCAFEILYWCGLRVGELLALTPLDLDFKRRVVMVRKSLTREDGKWVTSATKTSCSRRLVQMPGFVSEELMAQVVAGEIDEEQRIFPMTKHALRRAMDEGTAAAGLRRIRIHDLCHSHVSLLIDLGFPAIAIAERMGHASIAVTYRYAHLFPTRQADIVTALELEGAIR